MAETDRIPARIEWLSELLREAEAGGDHKLAEQCLASLLVLQRKKIQVEP